jgi:hypothetical protein
MMGAIREGECAEPGPYAAHCTDYPMHDYSCYDASEDVSFNDRHEFDHECTDPACPTPKFHNEGD